jgi:hypothetical protein
MQSIPGKYPAKYPVYRASHFRYLQRNFAFAIDGAKRVRRKFFGRCVPSVRASLLSSQCPSRINGFSQRITAVPDALQSHSVRTRHHARALAEGEALPGGYRVPRLVYSSFSRPMTSLATGLMPAKPMFMMDRPCLPFWPCLLPTSR